MLVQFYGTELLNAFLCFHQLISAKACWPALELSIVFMLELCISVSTHHSEVSAQAMNL